MTVDELLRRGGEREAAGDLEGAERAYRAADELNDAEGAILLGLVLKRRGELRNAVHAFQRAEARGHREAGSCLGNLLSDNGDVEGAKAAYQRSIAAGSADAVLNLGLILAQQGAVDEALPLLRAAQANGDPTASWAIGRLLERTDDLRGAAAAYRLAAVAGNADAAYGLGVVLKTLQDQEGALAAFQRAHDLGHEGAGKVLESLDIEAKARSSVQAGTKWAQVYVAACGEVLAATNACLEVANRAVGARNMAAQRPQHEISIQHFTKFAEVAEREFVPLYQRFAEVVAAARGTAAQFIASQADPLDAEMVLAASTLQGELENVATAKAILSANYGRSPDAFVQGVQESNELIQSGSEGNIYRPPAPTPSAERPCPWCAETIKAAAVICRFCGRDVHIQSNAR